MSRNNLLLIAFGVLVILAFLLGRSCEPVPVQKGLDRDSLQNIISDLNKDKKIATVKAVKSDSVRVKEIVKYRYLKSNPDTLPCGTVLKLVIQACDTVIVRDSIHIADLKQIIHVDSLIIGNQAHVIHSDSLTIVGLRKSYKKVRRQRNIFAVIAALLAGVAVVK